MKRSILVIGCGGHAQSVIDIIHSSTNWNIYGLIGRDYEFGAQILGHLVIGMDSDLKNIVHKCDNAVIAIGQIKSPSLRIKLSQAMQDLSFNFLSYRQKIHTSAVLRIYLKE